MQNKIGYFFDIINNSTNNLTFNFFEDNLDLIIVGLTVKLEDFKNYINKIPFNCTVIINDSIKLNNYLTKGCSLFLNMKQNETIKLRIVPKI